MPLASAEHKRFLSLCPQMEKYIAKMVKTGRYQTASEVVRYALRVLQEREELKRAKLAELRRKIQIGTDYFGHRLAQRVPSSF